MTQLTPYGNDTIFEGMPAASAEQEHAEHICNCIEVGLDSAGPLFEPVTVEAIYNHKREAWLVRIEWSDRLVVEDTPKAIEATWKIDLRGWVHEQLLTLDKLEGVVT